MGVHLGAIAVFLLLRLDKMDRPYSNWTRMGMWVLWWVGWVFYGVISRSGMFCALIGITAVLFVRPKSDWFFPVITGTLVMGFLLVSGLSVHVPDPTRNVSISFNQIKNNFLSLAGIGLDESGIQITPTVLAPGIGTGESGNQNTPTVSAQSDDLRIYSMNFRLDWWKKIIGYTFEGPYFWMGKGYGINLADDDGSQVTADHSLRSPHNAFMTILARSGVPGLVLWLAFLVTLAIQAARMIYARPARLDHPLISWTTIYILILLFNASVDVFLEGPMGGVWFWSMVGIIMLCRKI
jgi:hypothetical protein